MSHSLLTPSRAASLINEHMAAAFASGDLQETDQACFFFKKANFPLSRLAYYQISQYKFIRHLISLL